MANTLLLDRSTWDILIDANGNIAVATEPYSLAQDAASAIKTFLGECYWNTGIGVPYMTKLFGKNPSLAQIKTILAEAAMTVPDVVSATVYISAVTNRTVSGQVQVKSASTGQVSVAEFAAVSAQGVG